MDYGGQAVIEGVMMRSKKFMTTAVRLESGKVKVKREKLNDIPYSSILFLRGLFNLVETLKIGFRTLNWSAKQQLDENEKEGSGWLTLLATIFSVVVAVGLFKFLPLFLTKLVNPTNIFFFNLMDGAIKLLFFITYIWAISFFDDIKTVFMYHGAEHKAIGCLEAGKELTIENCRKFRKEHKRCGTNFLFTVIFISMIVYLLIPLNLGIWLNLLLRLLLLPIIAGFSYELIKLSGKFDNLFTKIISYPGILIQKLTTYEPNDKQLEIGIIALKEVLKIDKPASNPESL